MREIPDFLHEEVVRMPPISMADIEAIGEELLKILQPGVLEQPMAVDWRGLVEHQLEQHGIHVYPASPLELGDREGATCTHGEGYTEILIDEDLWDALLYQPGRGGNRARGTVAHELSHAVLHVPVIRRYKKMRPELLLNRVRRAELKPFRDPEWQAWALAGSLLAPRRTLELVQHWPLQRIADLYGISPSLLEKHMRRLKLEVSRA